MDWTRGGKRFVLVLLVISGSVATRGRASVWADELKARPEVRIRGVYGGVPASLLEEGKDPEETGINAVWVGSGSLKSTPIEALKKKGLKVFAEFNTMHHASYLTEHPDARPIGVDGKPCPPPDGWQGVCPTDPGYREERMEAFRTALADHEIDGIWLDYHHAHASWEQAQPKLPDTCFCPRCLNQFEHESGMKLLAESTPEKAKELLGPLNEVWVDWRCGVFTDWVRQFREIRDEVRPEALLGTFHCPWPDDVRDGAMKRKLAIDLKAQAPYLDVFSPMPYHARFGHGDDVAWISRQSAWLGRLLDVKGTPEDRIKIWPIIQLSNWGDPPVPPAQVAEAIDHGTRSPSTGVTVFNWNSLKDDEEKVEQMIKSYKTIRP